MSSSLNSSLPFDAADPGAALQQIPAHWQAVFALYGEDESAEPYIGLTPDLRRRLDRLLRPAALQTKRLQLVSRVRRIDWRRTGSEFESLLVQFNLLEEVYGAKALERMKLRAPAFVRFHGSNAYPRLTVTNRGIAGAARREAQWLFGPFASRAAAERYSEELLKLFLLRRCEDNLDPNPNHPGCVYSEMKMCLAPCYQGCTDARYAEEAERVRSFLATRGESRLVTIAAEREKAAEELEFETAAALHAQFQRVEQVRALAPELVHPLSELKACIVQTSVNPEEVALFVYCDGELRGPAPFSILGMRIQNEQSGSSSLYAQPMALAPVPEAGSAGAKAQKDVLELRLKSAFASLAESGTRINSTLRLGYLALLTRWYYRPQAKRAGEVFFAGAEGEWPVKAILRGIGRVAAASLR
jgi:hypothetical protein